MDRKIVYAGQQPLADDFLNVQRNALLGVGWLAQAGLGKTTVVDALDCTPTTPASLAVNIAAGSIYTLSVVDQTSYGTLTASSKPVVKQGVNQSTTQLTVTPPGTAGQSINYLIQAQYLETDTDSAVLSYFNASNPDVPWSGPNNSGVAQPTTRSGAVALQAKAGTAATSGTQVTPAPDAGWVGLYSITVAQGQSTVVAGNIATLSTAPFVATKLPDVPAAVQGGAWVYGTDTSATANVMTVALSPAPAAYNRMAIFVKKNGLANTGAMTINVNGIGSVSIITDAGAALTAGLITANMLAMLVFDGTSFRLMNAPITSSVGSITASSGEGINVTGGGVVSLNVPSLSAPSGGVASSDLVPIYSQADAHHRILTWSALITSITSSMTGSVQNLTVFSASGTWTRGGSTKRILCFAIGGGGGGGGDEWGKGSRHAGGGGAGAQAMFMADVSTVSSLSITIGAGGAHNASARGSTGGDTLVGTLCTLHGGTGGYPSSSSSGYTIGAPGWGGTGALDVGIAGVVWPGAPGQVANEFQAGHGASTLFGTGGYGCTSGAGAGQGPNAFNGGDGTYGGGGGGGMDGPGGAGGAGLVVIVEFA